MAIFKFTRPSRQKSSKSPSGVLPSPVDMMADALKDASRWLQTAGDTFGLECLKDAAARARSALKAVS
jgi:hypothetical protein